MTGGWRAYRRSKLVRDRVPEIMGARWRGHVAGEEEYRLALGAKLIEEAQEAATAIRPGPRLEEREELLGELADVLEVIRTLAIEYGSSLAEVTGRARAREQARGALRRGYIWHGEE
jgi:predicted house-cleaning noncanonical NTP pyrophosphatase (MazG superfamily)